MIPSREQTTDSFTEFFSESEPMLRHALIANCGPEVGREAAADAFEYAWNHWDRIEPMDHPVAYLYRVGRSAAKKYRRKTIPPEIQDVSTLPWVEPQLEPALLRLSDRQRIAVVLKNSFGYTYDEIARVMGVSITTVQKHNERALTKLRRRLEAN
jgi:DNA-directed RNA polymerase specialized sigma24 family protein